MLVPRTIFLCSAVQWRLLRSDTTWASLHESQSAKSVWFSERATKVVYYIYILFIFPTSTSHEPESHFHLQSMRQSHQQVEPYAQRRLDSFVSVCRYTQHVLTVYLSHVEISLKVSLEIETFTKKIKQNRKTQTAEIFLIRTTPARIYQDTLGEEHLLWVWSAVVFGGGGSYRVLTKAVC